MLCEAMRQRDCTCIQKLAELIVKLCAAFSGVEFGPLYYRALVVLKCAGLMLHRGNFDGIVVISQEAFADVDCEYRDVT